MNTRFAILPSIKADSAVRGWLIAPIAIVVALLPWIGANQYWVRQTLLVVMLAMVVSGLNLTFGFAGELSLGQAAIYAAGAFAGGYFAKEWINDLLLALIFAAVIAVFIGLLAGAPGIRLGGWMLAIASFFLVMLTPDIVNIIGEPLGGYEGLTGIPLPELFGQELSREAFYVAAIVIAALWFAVLRNLIVSPRGAEFRVIATGGTLPIALGVSSYRTKLTAYAVGAIPAGLAGTIYAYLDGYVAASSFGLHQVLVILAAGVLGGLRTVYGAILGAALLLLGPMSSSAFADYATVAFGLFLLLGGVFLPDGLAPVLQRLAERFTRRDVNGDSLHETFRPLVEFAPMAGGELTAASVSLAFGGNQALRDVTMRAGGGKVTALIGANGSGKTTMLNTISGYYTPDAGQLSLNSRDLAQMSGRLRARAGIGRTFQTPIIPADLTVAECVRTGAMKDECSLLSAALRLPSYRRRDTIARAEIENILAALGISDLANEEAASLPLGTRRLVELGRALALKPQVLLLDEVASGLDADEVEGLRQVISRLREAGVTVILVEHNFDLVASVADHVYVLAEGRLLAEGRPSEVADNPEVRATYLGSGPQARNGEAIRTDAGVPIAAQDRTRP